MLCSQQQALKQLSIGTLEKRLPPIIANQTTLLKHLTSLSLPADAGDADFSLYGQLVQHAPDLRHLAINGNNNLTALDDMEYIIEKLIEPRLQDQSKPLRLETLSLISLDFDSWGKYTSQIFEVENLVELKVGNSGHVAELLDAIADRFRQTKPRLQSLEITANDGDEYLMALERLLESFSGLRYLKVVGDYDEDSFMVSSLARHAPTLNDIYVSLNPTNEAGAGLIELEKLQGFFAHHSRLRQVAIDLPEIYQHDLDSAYGMAKYNKYLDTLKTLPSLQVLRILTRPRCMEVSNEYSHLYPQEEYNESVFDDLATHIVKRLVGKNGHSPLKLICIGEAEDFASASIQGYLPGIEPNVRCYYPGVQRDCFGGEQRVAIFCEAHLVKYDFPLWDAVVRLGDSNSHDNGLGAGDYKRSRIMY